MSQPVTSDDLAWMIRYAFGGIVVLAFMLAIIRYEILEALAELRRTQEGSGKK